jgi:hypothetical protein
MRVRDFPGNREEANRAGITPSNLFGTIDVITGSGGVGGFDFDFGCGWTRMKAEKSTARSV